MKKIHIKSLQAQGATACGKTISESTLVYSKEEIVKSGGWILCPKCLAAAQKQNRQTELFK